MNNNNIIYRQDAINSIKELPRWIMNSNGEFQPVDPPTVSMLDPEDAVSAIENLPSAQPEPCEDAVSRQGVYTVIEEVLYETTKGADNWYGLLNDGVRTLPSVTPKPEPRWISVSERLPEVGTYVLISKKSLGFRSNLPNVRTAHRSHDPRSGKEEWNDMLFGKLDDDDVLAWMPLPEPYAERREE